MTEGAVQIRTFATRYPFGSTLEEQVTGVEAAIRRRDSNDLEVPCSTPMLWPALSA